MDKFVVVRTDNEDINVVAYKDTMENALDTMMDNLVSYIHDKQRASILADFIGGNIEDIDEFLWVERGIDTVDGFMSAEISSDDCYHKWKVIPVAFE